MAIEANTPKDWGMRGATNTTLPQFKGKSRQLIVNIDDGYRPVIMDGITLGGRFKSASLDELNSGLAEKLGKTEKAESAKVADSANSVAGANVTGTVNNAIKATQDSLGNPINSTYATKNELTSGLDTKQPTGDYVTQDQLQESIKNAAGLPLGHHYAWPFENIPANSIQCNGATYNRELYIDFWQWLQDNNLVKSESEWQSIASSNGGYCPWYSDGDGTTNFRTPKFAPFMQVAIASGNVGNYHKAGLPNITGSLETYYGARASLSSASGAFSKSANNNNDAGFYREAQGSLTLDFSAKNSNNIYGNSTTVQPESTEWMICVVVLGQATNIGSADVADVMSAIAQVQADVGAIESSPVLNAKTYIKETWHSGNSWYRVYSDGFIIQSGFHPNRDSGGNPATITLPKPFTTTNYAVFRNPINFKRESSVVYSTGIKGRTKTSFTYQNDSGSYYDGCAWIAAGY